MRLPRLWHVLLGFALGCDAGEPPPALPHRDPIREASYAVEAARDEALRSEAQLGLLARDLGHFAGEVDEVVDLIIHAATRKDRDAARARLSAVQRQQAELQARLTAAASYRRSRTQ